MNLKGQISETGNLPFATDGDLGSEITTHFRYSSVPIKTITVRVEILSAD